LGVGGSGIHACLPLKFCCGEKEKSELSLGVAPPRGSIRKGCGKKTSKGGERVLKKRAKKGGGLFLQLESVSILGFDSHRKSASLLKGKGGGNNTSGGELLENPYLGVENIAGIRSD